MVRFVNWHGVTLVLLAAVLAVFALACGDESSAEADGDVVEDGDDTEDGDTPEDGDASEDGDEPDDRDLRCPPGMEFNDERGMCVPQKKKCPEGFRLNEAVNICVPKSQWDYALEGCSADGLELAEQNARYFIEPEGRWWTYTGHVGEEATEEILYMVNKRTDGGPASPGVYTLRERDLSLKTCAVCLVLYTGCEGVTVDSCSKAYMPSERASGEVEFTRLDNAEEGILSGMIRNVEMREVQIAEDGTTTAVDGGDTRCLSSLSFRGNLPSAGFVDMQPPEGLSCEYPAPPYHFIAPEPTQTEPWPGTVPPMGWPGAYIDNQAVGFHLAELYCDRPDIKTVFIMTGAGWCPACRSFYAGMICPDGKLEDQLRELGAEILYVVGDTRTPGEPATNAYADEYMDGMGCKGGIRISDTDNTAGKRIIWTTRMSSGIPWVSVIRTRDMKLIVEQDDRYYLDYLSIARKNLQEDDRE